MKGSYDHTQSGRFHWLLVGLAAATSGIALFVPDGPRWVLVPAALLFASLAAAFVRLRVFDDGDRLVLRYGPLPLFGWSIRYDELGEPQPARSHLIDGWGVHWVPRRGWTLNLWGFECVELRSHGRLCRIGTDDAENLAAFLRTRLADKKSAGAG